MWVLSKLFFMKNWTKLASILRNEELKKFLLGNAQRVHQHFYNLKNAAFFLYFFFFFSIIVEDCEFLIEYKSNQNGSLYSIYSNKI
jgi:hypothetical protein